MPVPGQQQAPAKRKSKEEVLQAKLAAKNAALVKCEVEILHLSDEIKHRAASLKQLRASEKSMRVANARLVSHHKAYQIDLKNRPPDRGDDIRAYSKMDLDVWAYPQVREWFNKNSETTEGDNSPLGPPSYKLRPSQTGYTIRVEDDYHATAAHHR